MEEARAADVDAVMALERATEGAPHWAEAVYREMLGSRGTELRGWMVVVARDGGGAVVGFAVGTEVGGVAELESLAVAEGWRRRGVGRAMCLAVVGWARERGAGAIELEVWEGNHGAMRLYEAMRWKEVGRRRGYYGEGRDARLMRLDLRSATGLV